MDRGREVGNESRGGVEEKRAVRQYFYPVPPSESNIELILKQRSEEKRRNRYRNIKREQ